MSNPSNQVPDHLNALLQLEKKHEDAIKKFEDIEQKLQAKKDHLLKFKQRLVAVNRSSSASKIAKINAEVQKIDKRNSHAQREIRKIKVLVNANMTGYINKFICLSDMTPQIIELLQLRGITTITMANNSNISELKRTANEPAAVPPKRAVDKPVPIFVAEPVVFQPEETDDEPMPVLEKQEPVQEPLFDEEDYIVVVDDDDQNIPEEQDDVPSSVEDYAAHLRDMVIEFKEKMKIYQDDRLKLEREYQATKGSGTSTVKNKLDSFNSHIRVATINHQFEMIEFVKKNLSDDQFTAEILDYLDESSRKQPFKKPVTVASFKQMKSLQCLIEADNKLNKIVSDRDDIIIRLTELIGEEEANDNLQTVERYKKIISEKEQDLEGKLEEAEKNRRRFATKYCPEKKDNFVNENLQTFFRGLIADAADHKFLSSEKTLRDRLEILSEKLSEEHDQVISSIQSTSTSFNFNGLFETFADPETDAPKESKDADGETEDRNGGWKWE